jgi:hypothetical protein
MELYRGHYTALGSKLESSSYGASASSEILDNRTGGSAE